MRHYVVRTTDGFIKAAGKKDAIEMLNNIEIADDDQLLAALGLEDKYSSVTPVSDVGYIFDDFEALYSIDDETLYTNIEEINSFDDGRNGWDTYYYVEAFGGLVDTRDGVYYSDCLFTSKEATESLFGSFYEDPDDESKIWCLDKYTIDYLYPRNFPDDFQEVNFKIIESARGDYVQQNYNGSGYVDTYYLVEIDGEVWEAEKSRVQGHGYYEKVKEFKSLRDPNIPDYYNI